jgi:arylsulfatase A-like enzyme
MAFGHADFGSNKLVEPIIGLSGHHRPDGVLIIAGPGVQAGTNLEGANILDLAPTLLHAMGVAVPSELDGRVLGEAFEPSSPMAQPVTYTEANVYKEKDSRPDLSDEEMAEVQDKLRGWGYAG